MYKYFFLLSLIKGVKSNQEEKDLINYLFEDYNSDVRPVYEFNDALEVQIGLGVKTIESFE